MRQLGVLLFYGLVAIAQNLNGVVAIVNNDIITAHEFELSLNRAQMMAPANMQHSPQLQNMVLDQLILESLEKQAAKAAGVEVTKEAVEEAFEQAAADHHMSIEEFENSLKEEGASKADFLQHLEKQMLIGQYHRQSIVSQIHVNPHEVKQLVQSTDSPIGKFRSLELEHLLIEETDNDAAIELNAQIKALIKSGKSFSEIVARFEQSPLLRHTPLGSKNVSEIPSLFSNLIADMKPGKIFGPIENSSGYHYLFVKSDRIELPTAIQERFKAPDGKPAKLEVVSNALAVEYLREKKFYKALSDWQSGLKEEAYIETFLDAHSS